jgi:hypothetical protein
MQGNTGRAGFLENLGFSELYFRRLQALSQRSEEADDRP